MNLIVIPGPASQALGQEIARLAKLQVAPIETKHFPDGESRIRFTKNVENEDVIIVQTTSPPQNENLLQLFLMADNAKDLKAKSITAVIPYFAYARQDQRFRYGETFSVKTIVDLLAKCGVNQIITVNSHNPKILSTLSVPIQDLSAVNLLASYFKRQGFDGALSLSLGKKAVAMAAEADKVLQGGYDYISTRRDRVTGKVTLEEKTLPAKNRDVVIFDDIISSGGTMIKAVELVKLQDARRVYAACVHPLLIGDAREKILRSGADGIVGTNCVSSPVSIVSVAPLIAEALSRGT
ncbi:MAG: ribose-phosphate pyrophosphokinase [Candidatus Bathyarchaeota archaeon]|nr:ribose-phosphate pyrophosphokinase [Candidatus Bathyarchaeota archaeon]